MQGRRHAPPLIAGSACPISAGGLFCLETLPPPPLPPAPPPAGVGVAGGRAGAPVAARPPATGRTMRRGRRLSQREDGAARGLACFQVAVRLLHVGQRVALVDVD